MLFELLRLDVFDVFDVLEEFVVFDDSCEREVSTFLFVVAGFQGVLHGLTYSPFLKHPLLDVSNPQPPNTAAPTIALIARRFFYSFPPKKKFGNMYFLKRIICQVSATHFGRVAPFVN